MKKVFIFLSLVLAQVSLNADTISNKTNKPITFYFSTDKAKIYTLNPDGTKIETPNSSYDVIMTPDNINWGDLANRKTKEDCSSGFCRGRIPAGPSNDYQNSGSTYFGVGWPTSTDQNNYLSNEVIFYGNPRGAFIMKGPSTAYSGSPWFFSDPNEYLTLSE